MNIEMRKYLLQSFIKFFILNHSELLRRFSDDEEIVNLCFKEVLSVLSDQEIEVLCNDPQKRFDLLKLERVNDRIYFELIKQGNHNAISDLMKSYTPQIRFYFYSLLGKKFIYCNRNIVNDVIDSEWCKLWLYRENYDYSIASFVTYFIRIVYNALREIERKLSNDAQVIIWLSSKKKTENVFIDDPIEYLGFRNCALCPRTPENICVDYHEGQIVLGYLFKTRLAPVWKIILYGIMISNYKIGYIVQELSEHNMYQLLSILKTEISNTLPESVDYLSWLFREIHEDIEQTPSDLFSKFGGKSDKKIAQYTHIPVKHIKLKDLIKGEQTLSNWKFAIKRTLRKHRLRQIIEEKVFF